MELCTAMPPGELMGVISALARTRDVWKEEGAMHSAGMLEVLIGVADTVLGRRMATEKGV